MEKYYRVNDVKEIIKKLTKEPAYQHDGEDFYAHFNAECGRAVDLITGEDHDFGGGSKIPPYTARFWKCER